MNLKTKIIKIEGKSSEAFFQNLITNDIKLLENNQALYSAMLTPQGKFLADFILIKDLNFLFFEVNKNNAEELVNLIKKYDLRKSLKISIQEKMKTYFILYKKTPLNIINKIKKIKILKENESFMFFDPRKDNFLLRIWSYGESLNSLPQELDLSISEKTLNLERIKNSVPDSSIDLEKEKSFILNYNFDALNAISFTKGCYIGQENTSRQNYRGKIKYILKTIKLIEGKFPQPHETLFFKNQKIGTMKSHVENYGLALLRTDFFEVNKEFSLDKFDAKLLVI
mgnify:CR=1 FL=1|tara:strand:- start:22 stop:870 length:849 start_codon:yes stop_codon:yes gene_type:complete